MYILYEVLDIDDDRNIMLITQLGTGDQMKLLLSTLQGGVLYFNSIMEVQEYTKKKFRYLYETNKVYN